MAWLRHLQETGNANHLNFEQLQSKIAEIKRGEKCLICKGKGDVMTAKVVGTKRPCKNCFGTGFVNAWGYQCQKCNGSGVSRKKKIEVKERMK